jgi:hypothetical protein
MPRLIQKARPGVVNEFPETNDQCIERAAAMTDAELGAALEWSLSVPCSQATKWGKYCYESAIRHEQSERKRAKKEGDK